MRNALVPAPSFAPKPKNPPTTKKDNPAKDAICHQCGEVGHWRRNCPLYLAELIKNKKLSQGASTSGIFTIELYSFPSTSWVYNTGCGTHICITTQGLRGSRKLKPGALSLYVGDGHRASVEAIREFHLCLPSGLVLIIHNCHYAPFITRGIISVSCLYKDSFVNRFENDNTILVSRNNLVYFNAILWDDIYEIDLSYSNTNDNSMYAISNKRAKLNLDSTLLWHCRLGHISKKRIKKLQHDGLLDSIDIKSFEKCVSCMSGKMVKKPYSHQVERAKDLLRLIHTDEVENQLGKTIKSLRSDRGDEYMSQEFLDHLKEHGIIAHRTPPYMPQHNGVSERRNRTLLDMVCSMMSQTTLPKSFWDYALESAARILNLAKLRRLTRHHAIHKRINEVWELVDLPPNGKTVGHKWLFKKKTDMDGVVHTYKVRLVAKGFTQTPGIDYEENHLSCELHWTTVKNILKDLRNTKYMFLVYEGDTKRELRVSCYTDDGYLTDAGDLKSQTGYVFVLNKGVVDWKSTKQSIFASSSTDVEYIAAFDASKEGVWIHKFISGLGVVPTIKEPINMYCDNTGAISIAKDHGVTKGARHFHIKVHYLRKTIKMGDVRIEKVDTNENLADPFTKALGFPKHSELTKKIRMIPASSLM
ncbi:zinc finger, CCHC-type containing protein [Tanacetum coccineum]